MPRTTDDRVRENRIRRAAARRGMQLIRSRRRDEKALDYGHYWLVDVSRSKKGRSVLGGRWGVTLDEVEEWLELPS